MRVPALVLLSVLLLSSCWATRPVYEGEAVTLSTAGAPSVSEQGFELRLWFDVAGDWPETIQRVRMGFEGVESHRQPMWAPDFQTFTRRDSSPRHVHRRNTVSPGRTRGAPWRTLPGQFKGVCMIDGWLDESGHPRANHLYFDFGGRQGGVIVEERVDLSITYTIDWWSRAHPENPVPGRATLRLAIGDVSLVWSE